MPMCSRSMFVGHLTVFLSCRRVLLSVFVLADRVMVNSRLTVVLT